MTTQDLIEIVHNHVAYIEREIKWALRELAADDDRGWSEDTLSLRWLRSDAELLRELAAAMDERHSKLTRENLHVVENG